MGPLSLNRAWIDKQNAAPLRHTGHQPGYTWLLGGIPFFSDSVPMIKRQQRHDRPNAKFKTFFLLKFVCVKFCLMGQTKFALFFFLFVWKNGGKKTNIHPLKLKAKQEKACLKEEAFICKESFLLGLFFLNCKFLIIQNKSLKNFNKVKSQLFWGVKHLCRLNIPHFSTTLCQESKPLSYSAW